jgi:1,4-dihydroxy-2-naphthoate polyprenyltransferase
MSSIRAWFKASRLASQSNIFVPLFTGQMFYLLFGGEINWTIFAIVHLYGLFMQLYIVYANDYADVETDRINRTYTIFSGGSRVLIDGDLSPKALGIAAVVMVLLSVLTGVVLAVLFGRTLAPVLIIAGIALLWMYSFRPVHLSYRGGGEVLQVLGVGVVLPLVGFYAQSGDLTQFPLETLVVILPTQLACAMATSIPDFDSDRQSNKRTSTVLLGQKNVRVAIIALNMVAIAAFFVIDWASFSGLKQVWPLAVLAVIALALLSQVPKIQQKRAIYVFVMSSFVLTTGIMGQLAYVAAAMHP